MKKITILMILVFSIFSCDDILKEVPKDRISEANFYKTVSDGRAAVDAIYGVLSAGQLFAHQYLLQIEIPADFAYGRGSTIPIGGEYTGLDAVNQRRVGLMWDYFYQAVNYANIAIEKIPGIEGDESAKSLLVAEAKFLRALCYYHLVRDFGAVPLRLNSTDGDMARTPVADVYNAVIADLQAAESGLPASITVYGRPSKWGAKIMFAEVYLTLGDWAKARDKAKEVMDSGDHSLVEITKLNDWDNLFGPTVNGTSEEIFSIKYNAAYGWSWPFYLAWKADVRSAYGAYVLYSDHKNPFIINWDDDDLRKQWGVFTTFIDKTSGAVDTLVFPTMCFAKFRDPSAPGARSSGNDFPMWRYADALLIYAEAASQAEGGPSAMAIDALNQVKRRGYGYPSNTASAVDYPSSGWSAESFRDTVLQERAYEFISEGKRWKDLKRSGKAKEKILENIGKVVADRYMLWPIPQWEIDANTALSQANQNPGY
jgi:hypothetical protein